MARRCLERLDEEGIHGARARPPRALGHAPGRRRRARSGTSAAGGLSGDPVSWLVGRARLEVVGPDGEEIGKVEETVGDSNRDIFNGLTVASGFFSRARYVPAERVAEIRDGLVRLSIGEDEFKELDHFEEPPPSEQIEPE